MAIIGLEIHAYLNTKEKLFCRCLSEHGTKNAEPNTNICPICTGQPGSKPLLPNEEAIKKAIQIGLLLNCEIKEKVAWQRKHYSWPDLPKGFQTTISGPHAIPNAIEGNFYGIKILECHLEEDPAAWNPETGEIDYNRSGSPLIEIVTAPDFTSSEQVVEWLKSLLITLDYIKAIDKKAGIKSDVNISLPEKKGARIEIKNVNSLTNIKKAIEYEINRQNKVLPLKQETRRFNLDGTTTKMRSKEEAEDYRFISEPDLPVLKIDRKKIEKLKKELPETPKEKIEKIIKKHKINKKHAEILTKKLEIAEFFEKVMNNTKGNALLTARWITEELLSVLNYLKKELEEIEIDPYHFVELLDMVEEGVLTELKAKDILRSWKKKSESPKKLTKTHITISNKEEIEKIAKEILSSNSKAVEDYKNGQKNAINFLIGQMMQKTNKRADYKTSKEIIENLLEKK
jgi:aspartyl-tRNA(Asn)/glutamyl-tRNA(Gln) amidotransferase subunit B